ncbi:MAG: hypothetical protein CBD18_01305 [Opitutales bacterium TMED158]|nr:MAG: hypothetical protein CBD18_01305 [Opitutales bacterium TMED158]
MDASPKSIEELQSLVRSASALSIRAREDRLDPGPNGSTAISLSAFNRTIEYEPEEYTITVESGALVRDVQNTLAEQGQYLPFDPPFLDDNPTIGDAIASGCSGPSAYRYGILRDFIIGLSLIDGLGKRIQAGGKVVKNAAGFDLPKLMVGSGHGLGIVTQATFKVFPKPEASRSVEFECDNLDQGIGRLKAIGRSRFTLDALDLDPSGALRIQLGGQANALDRRVHDLEEFLNAERNAIPPRPWSESVALARFPDSGSLVRVPTNPTAISDLEAILADHGAVRRYSLGGFVCWIYWNSDIDSLDALLRRQDLSGQIVNEPFTLIGSDAQRSFYDRVKGALDPHSKFPNLYPNR